MQKEVFFSINKINSIPDDILGVYFLYSSLFFGVFIHGSLFPHSKSNGDLSFSKSKSKGSPCGPEGLNTLLNTLNAPASKDGFLIDSTK